MKIILNQSVDSLGGEGEIIEVKAGYARNYLIPKGWAKQATKTNIVATENKSDEGKSADDETVQKEDTKSKQENADETAAVSEEK